MSYAQITIDRRRALLDALVALRAHRDALVLVGAQAIYLYTGEAITTRNGRHTPQRNEAHTDGIVQQTRLTKRLDVEST